MATCQRLGWPRSVVKSPRHRRLLRRPVSGLVHRGTWVRRHDPRDRRQCASPPSSPSAAICSHVTVSRRFAAQKSRLIMNTRNRKPALTAPSNDERHRAAFRGGDLRRYATGAAGMNVRSKSSSPLVGLAARAWAMSTPHDKNDRVGTSDSRRALYPGRIVSSAVRSAPHGRRPPMPATAQTSTNCRTTRNRNLAACAAC